MKWIKINFIRTSKSGITNIYRVESIIGKYLGAIQWYGGWRKYVFYPANNTIFEEHCLRDIALFLEVATKKYKALHKALTGKEGNDG